MTDTTTGATTEQVLADLQYMTEGPAHEHGGFHPAVVETAKRAIEIITRLRAGGGAATDEAKRWAQKYRSTGKTLEECFGELIAERDEARKWIKCSERMPLAFDRVLFVYSDLDGKWIVGYGKTTDYGGKPWHDLDLTDQCGVPDDIHPDRVTHWMPIPAPPQAEGRKGMRNKHRCTECQEKLQLEQILTAPNPFDPEDRVSGCPKCKAVNSMELVCDEPDCWKVVSCGTPTDAGYRHTCGNHRPDRRPTD
jgi:hypothetical protein